MRTATIIWNGTYRYHSISCVCSACLWLDEFLPSRQTAPAFETPPIEPVPAAGRGYDLRSVE